MLQSHHLWVDASLEGNARVLGTKDILALNEFNIPELSHKKYYHKSTTTIVLTTRCLKSATSGIESEYKYNHNACSRN